MKFGAKSKYGRKHDIDNMNNNKIGYLTKDRLMLRPC